MFNLILTAAHRAVLLLRLELRGHSNGFLPVFNLDFLLRPHG